MSQQDEVIEAVRFDGDVLLLHGECVVGREAMLAYEHVGLDGMVSGEEVVVSGGLPFNWQKRVTGFCVFSGSSRAGSVGKPIAGARVRLLCSRTEVVGTLVTDERGSTPPIEPFLIVGSEWFEVGVTLPGESRQGDWLQPVRVGVRGPLYRSAKS